MASDRKPDPAMFVIQEYKGTYHYVGTQFDQMRDLKCRQDDIWVCSYPRSGTTLTQHTVYLIKTLDFEKATTELLDDWFPMIELEVPAYPRLRGPKYVDAMPDSEPRFIKTHLHYFLLPEELRAGKGKIIYIVRNPKSVVPSQYRIQAYLKQGQAPSMRAFLERFLTGQTVYASPWGLHVCEYWGHRNDDNILFLQFEDSLKDRHGTVRRIATFLGKELTDADVDKIVEYTSLDSMKKNKAVNLAGINDKYNTNEGAGQFINTGEVSGWRKDIPEDLVKEFDDFIEREIGHTDIKFM